MPIKVSGTVNPAVDPQKQEQMLVCGFCDVPAASLR